jgi:hypothetical protein
VTQKSGAEPALPAQRAFVMQLHAAADLAQGQVSGRVEHVVSGQATHFCGVDSLLAFMARMLATLPSEPPEEG